MAWKDNIAALKAYLFFDDTDMKITEWMRKYGIMLLRYAIGIVFIWFGLLKIMGASPVVDLVAKTVYWVNPSWFVPFLGVWEIVIGICFIIRPLVRLGVLLMLPQMIGTLLPLFILPEIVYRGNPFFLTTAGEFIVKNFVLISAAIAVGATVRDVRIKEYFEKKDYIDKRKK